MAKNTNPKPQIKKCKEHPYYKNHEARQRASGKGARIKHKTIRRKLTKFIKKNPEYRGLEGHLAVALLMVQHSLSYRGMVDELNYDKTMRKKIAFRTRLPSHVYDGM